MEKPAIDHVLRAINTLFNEQDSSRKEEASKWLGELQHSAARNLTTIWIIYEGVFCDYQLVYAWEIADHLLSSKTDTTTCYFGAQTMRTKIQFFFHELQPSQYESLKNSLLNHVIHLHGSSQPVINQLCLAIADLAVQMPQWTDPVRDLIERFSKSMKMIPDLLEMLKYLTEEVKKICVGSNRREEVINQLRQSSLVVIQLLNACIDQVPNEESIRKKIFDCFGGWLLLGAFPPDEVMKSRLLPTLLETLVDEKSDDVLQESAADVLCHAIYSAEELGPQSPMAVALFSEVLKLVPIYEQAQNNKDVDRCLNLCRVFTELAEATLGAVISSKGQAILDLRSVALMVKCVQHDEYEVVEITFNYWYNLSEALFREELKMRRESFHPYYQALCEYLCLICKLDYEGEEIPKTQTDFGEFRSRVVDLVKDCVFLIGSNSLFLQLCQKVINDYGKVVWQDIEAQLFIMAAIAPNITVENSEHVSSLFNTIFTKPNHPPHIAVKYTAIKMIGELGEWIDKNPEILDAILLILYQGLQSQNVSSVSAESLQKVCSSCQKKMAQHFTILLEIVKAIDSLSISTTAVLQFFQGVARVLSELPQEQIEEGMKQMCVQQVHLLAQLLDGRNGGHTDPTIFLDRIATIFRYTVVNAKNSENHPCFAVLQEMWPVISMTFSKYKNDVRIMERSCRCVRFIVRCLGTHFCPLLGELVTQMMQVYTEKQHSCFLYLGSILVDEFGSEKSCVPGFIQMVEGFCPPTFGFLNSADAFVEHPDTVDDLFRLCTRCVQICPVEFLRCSVADSLVKCAVAASTLSHREAHTSVMTFLRDLIHGPNDQYTGTDTANLRNLIVHVMTVHGQNITIGLVQACAGKIPSYMVPNIGDVFWEMLRYNKQEASDWLIKALELLPTQTVSGNTIVTKHQLSEFHHAVTSADACKVISRAARTFSKLYD